jgi:hypothetical protein
MTMAAYESDITQFMRQFMTQHPEEIASQKKGRDTWWDKDPQRERSAPAVARHAPKAGGAEHTFQPLSEPNT